MDVAVGETLLALQSCWDGANVFEFSGSVFWPLDLRSKSHVGMHVVFIFDGKSIPPSTQTLQPQTPTTPPALSQLPPIHAP